ncbi:alpha/beta hydrolase [Rhodobacteraceae bacterium R_SAG10]|nr:alpha/beta hydrolase [Rhodobacteraceae bacterium R_SAG10]
MDSITIAGQSISYRVAGAGPTVILLHCSSSHSGQWKALIADLASDFTVLAPDFHGYGHSDALPRDGRPFFEHDSAIVTGLAARFGGRAHLVGHSLGGTIALRVAIHHPELVRGLSLIEPVQFSILAEMGDAERCEYFELVATVDTLIRLKGVGDAARWFVDFWAGDGAFDALDGKTQTYTEQTIGRVTDDSAGLSLRAPGQIRLADCRALAMPCQIIRGGATRASTRAICAHLAREIPGVEVEDIPRVGHMAAAVQPGVVNPVIARFLRRVALDTG